MEHRTCRNFRVRKPLSQGLITVASALNRTESRGAHARDDFPERDDEEWLKHSLVKLDGNDISVSYRKVNLETMTDEVESVPPKGEFING